MDNQFNTNDVINKHAGNCTVTKLPVPLACHRLIQFNKGFLLQR